MMKSLIKKSIEEGKVKESWEMIQQYETECPYDPEILILKSRVAIMIGDIEAADALSAEGLRLLPYNPDVYYNRAYISEKLGNIGEEYEYYSRAKQVTSLGGEHTFNLMEVNEKIEQLTQKLKEMAETHELNDLEVDYLNFSKSVKWEYEFSVFHAINADVIGKRYYDYSCFPPMYVAFANNLRNCFKNRPNGSGQECTTTDACAEMQRLSAMDTTMDLELDRDYYIPVAADERCSITINNDLGKTIAMELKDKKQFYNLRFPKGRYSIESDAMLNFGTRIPIGHEEERKRVVISLFVDGLAQDFVDGHLEELMPYTYGFFRKGLICKNAYSTGDWTLPCIVSAFTGQTSASHRLVHPDKLHKIDLTIPLLSEFFAGKGYNNTKIGGDWRITPTYGYGRGFHRIIYQHGQSGLDIENIISLSVEQLYSMKDTDQFICLELGDLHCVADERLLAPLMNSFSVMDMQNLQGSENSVKQEYDPMKVAYYKEKLKFVDRKLAALYQYLEDNYEEDEFVVVLFSDHGQGYMLNKKDEFLGDARSKIALMTRGSGIVGESEELISLCDYPEILCKLAGIEYNSEFSESNLLKCFGGNFEREFVITETIHPGDPYRVALRSKDYAFFLTGAAPMGDDCLVELDDYSATLCNKQGEVLDNAELKDAFTKICLERVASNMRY